MGCSTNRSCPCGRPSSSLETEFVSLPNGVEMKFCKECFVSVGKQFLKRAMKVVKVRWDTYRNAERDVCTPAPTREIAEAVAPTEGGIIVKVTTRRLRKKYR